MIPAAGVAEHTGCPLCVQAPLGSKRQPQQMAITTLPIPERKKRRLGKVKSLAPGHTARNWHPELSDSQAKDSPVFPPLDKPQALALALALALLSLRAPSLSPSLAFPPKVRGGAPLAGQLPRSFWFYGAAVRKMLLSLYTDFLRPPCVRPRKPCDYIGLCLLFRPVAFSG